MCLDSKLVLSASLAIAIAACARDVEMPPPSSAPRIARFSPAMAYAGEPLTITGSGFDTDPIGNLVQFARASARADSASEGTLVVRVPADAGDGPFTVTTRGGVSAPSSAGFGYLGRGELTENRVTAEIPMLHKPYRVLPVRDETFLHSDLLLGIVRYGDPSFVDAYGVYMDQARWTQPDPSVIELWTSYPHSALVQRTVAPDGAVGVNLAPLPGYTLGPIVAMQAAGGRPDTVAVFEVTGATTTVELRRIDASFSALYAATTVRTSGTSIPVADIRNCVDAGGGDLACLGRARVGDPLTIFRLRITSTPTATATFAGTPPATVVENRFLPEDPLCADTTTHRVVAALSDGRLASLDVSTLTSTTPFTVVSTGARTPPRSLTCVPGTTGYATATGPTVLVSKDADDLLTRMDPMTGSNRWTASIPRVSYAGLWCPDTFCAGTGATVHAAGEADNGIRVLDLATGALLWVRSLDVGAGRVDAPSKLVDRTANQGATWYQPDRTPYLAFLTTSPPGVIEWPLTAQRTFGVFPHYVADPDVAVVVPWATRPGEIPTGYAAVGRHGLAYSNESGDLTPSFAGTALLAVDNVDPDLQLTHVSHLHVGTTDGLETVDWYATVTTVARNEFPPAQWMSLSRLPSGIALGALAIGPVWSVAGWTEAEAASGASPRVRWRAPGNPSYTGVVLGAAQLDQQLWAFYWDADTLSTLHAVALTDQLVTVDGSDRELTDPFYSIIAVSPNGRSFVSWDYQPFSRNTTVVIWAPDGTGGFVRRATIRVQGQISGAAFDGSGEQLYVVTRGPDQIVVIQ